MDVSESLLAEFLVESEEQVQLIADALSKFEKGQDTPETLNEIYRATHTMKGSALLVGLSQLGALTHAMETSLGRFREQKKKLTEPAIDAMYRCLSVIERLVASLSQKKGELDCLGELKELIPRLIEVNRQEFPGDESAEREFAQVMASLEEQTQERQARAEEPEEDGFSAETPPPPTPSPVPTAQSAPPPAPQASAPASPGSAPPAASAPSVSEASAAPATPPPTASAASAPAASATPTTPSPTVSSAIPVQTEAPPAPPRLEETPAGGAETGVTIRVQVSVLDRLMALVGEMVLVRNQVRRYAERLDELEFLKITQRFDSVTAELQDEVMKTRMQPTGTLFNKYQRVVRDLSRSLGKRIQLHITGGETELDKSLLEAIKDPLMHIVRNACDHGIELPHTRQDKGKNPTGRLELKAYHEGGHVVIEFRDDGKGLNREDILSKAIERRLVRPELARTLTDKEIFQFIFTPGFSTAQAVTEISGRGIGMDVVKANVDQIGGSIEIDSLEGYGTTLRMRIPLTLAIVPALIVRAGGETFAIPQVKLVELVRFDLSEAQASGIEILQGRPVYRLRGSILPLVSLAELLNLDKFSESSAFSRWADFSREQTGEFNVVIVNAEGRKFGLVVDEIQDHSDIVVKPLARCLAALGTYAGATILGDGSISMILDITGIARMLEVFDEKEEAARRQTVYRIPEPIASARPEEYLVFRGARKEKFCVPVALIHRLEKFDVTKVETFCDQEVVRYGPTIMPILRWNHFLGVQDTPKPVGDKYSVMVIQRKGKLYGILVDEILDVIAVEKRLEDFVRNQPGFIGNLILEDEVVVVVDVFEVIGLEMELTDGVQAPEEVLKAPGSFNPRSKFRILYAEDTEFFRRRVVGLLASAGFKVIPVENGEAALDYLDKHPGQVDLVLSDIEMPKLDGYQLAQTIRGREGLNQLPLVALTTRFNAHDQSKGREAGFDLYLQKFQNDEVLEGIDRLLRIRK